MSGAPLGGIETPTIVIVVPFDAEDEPNALSEWVTRCVDEVFFAALWSSGPCPVGHVTLIVSGDLVDWATRLVLDVAPALATTMTAPATRLIDRHQLALAGLVRARAAGQGPGLITRAETDRMASLLSLVEVDAATVFVEDTFVALQTMDPSRRRDLLRCVEAVLAHRTLTEAGRQLGQHAKTVAARVRTFQDLTGFSLSSLEDRLHLRVALALQRQHSAA